MISDPSRGANRLFYNLLQYSFNVLYCNFAPKKNRPNQCIPNELPVSPRPNDCLIASGHRISHPKWLINWAAKE